ncbi:hypothetical protein ACFLSZ_02525 [Candidatus Bipolaricaulota bacterium]
MLSSVLLVIAIISVLWGVVSSIAIANALQKRGLKVNWILLRVMILKYIGQYWDITRKETGRTGPWFYSFAISMNLALATAIVGLFLEICLA